MDCSRLPKCIPAFKPQWTAQAGAKELYEAYKTHGITLEDFEGPRFQRIGHIRKLLAENILGSDLRFN